MPRCTRSITGASASNGVRVIMPDDLAALRAAWERLRPARPDWPSTFEDAMHTPLIAALLRVYANHPEAAQSAIDRRAPVAPPRDLSAAPAWEASRPGDFNPDNARIPARIPTMPANPPPPVRRKWAGVDFKSRAAGEKPESED